MAVAPTGAIFKTLEFDGENSGNYGVYISGEAVFNAPERDVEMITIPNRNGSFALDNGRFENIEVTYPAGIFADNETDFAQAISDFRNFLCSKRGYCRLTDDYNPDEYRMAIYKSGLEVTPAQLKAGEFEITFECKPQRYLMSGEAAVEITSGDTLLNPTPFDASPMLVTEGTGQIKINDASITVNRTTLGEIPLDRDGDGYFITTNVNTGDSFYQKKGSRITWTIWHENGEPITVYERNLAAVQSVAVIANGSKRVTLQVDLSRASGTIGTDKLASFWIEVEVRYVETSENIRLYGSFSYMDNRYRLIVHTPTSETLLNTAIYDMPQFYAESSKTVQPMYIDLDLGDAYGIDSGEIVPFNNAVELPAKLPTLSSETNVITFDNTITDLKIIPRWWKI